MDIVEKIRSEADPEDAFFWTWQYELARRIAQLLEEHNLTQREFAVRVGLTDAQVSAILYSSANPTLSVLARIASRLPADLLNWVDNGKSEKPQTKRPANPAAKKRKKNTSQ